jgi:hypothetical protein
MKRTKKQLVLNKGREKFIFRYESGCEDKLLDALIKQVKEKKTSFDWFDAAVLSFKLTQSLIRQADELLCKGPQFCSQMQGYKTERSSVSGNPDVDAEIKTV